MPKPKILFHPALLTLTLILTSPLFFFKLGQSSLTSFDEAWYAEIGKQLLITGTPFSLRFNSKPFVDHPPAGFWLISSTQAIFGITEFGSRAAGAIAGLLTLAVIYLFGRILFNSTVGLSSLIALASSPWFIFRARSANLDSFITLFYLTTLLLAFVSIKKPKFIGAFFVILTALLLSKTASPFTILPALVLIFWKSPVVKTPMFKISLTLSLITVFSYFLTQYLNNLNYLNRLIFVGAPKVGQASLLENINLVKTYLHLGIGAWFKPAVFALPFALFLRKKSILYLLFALFFFLFPFTLSPKTQIWHLIPTHPLLILISIGTVFYVLKTCLPASRSLFRNHQSLAAILTLTLTVTISLPQIKRNWREFVDIPRFVTDEAILSRKAAEYSYPLVIDENFVPAAVFYSNKTVSWLNAPRLQDLALPNQVTLIITHLWRLDRDQVSPNSYQILATDRDRVLLLFPQVPSSQPQ